MEAWQLQAEPKPLIAIEGQLKGMFGLRMQQRALHFHVLSWHGCTWLYRARILACIVL